MIKKFFAFAVLYAIVLNVFGTAAFAAASSSAADAKSAAKQTAQLAAQLPASDAVMTLNVQRLVGEALPQVLSGNQPLLAEIVGKIDELKNKTGFDLRQFEQVAVGVSSLKNANQAELDLQPLILARGALNANALIAVGKIAANGKYREEKIGARTVYIFSPQQFLPPRKSAGAAPDSTATKKAASFFERIFGKTIDTLSREVAVTAFDTNTLAVGSLARVRETFAAAPRRVPIGADVLSMVNRRPSAIAAFGLKLSEGMSSIIPNLGNDEIAQSINSIRYLAASLDAEDGNVAVSASAKTLRPEQAKDLQEKIIGLLSLSSVFLGGSGADKQVFRQMAENLKVARVRNEVTLDLQIPQTDINILLSKKK